MNNHIFQASFTDVFGVEHPAAQCMISSISTSSNLYFDNEGGTTSSQQHCNYQVRYWHSPEARAAGARPQDFMDANLVNTMYISDSEILSGSDMVSSCKEHFLNSVIARAEAEGSQA